MAAASPVLLYVSDRPVLLSLEFSLSLQGFEVADACGDHDPNMAACLVIDQGSGGGSIDLLASLRATNCETPALLLSTNPTQAFRAKAAAVGAGIIEKPLLGEDLTQALHVILTRKGSLR